MGIIRCENSHSGYNVSWAKANLQFIKNVTSFEVYQDKQDVPPLYRNVPDFYIQDNKRVDPNKTYRFILRNDENESEVWFAGCNCGYGGTGPNATMEILQLVGVKMDYQVISENSSIIMNNIITHHHLNLVFFKPLNRFNTQTEELLNVFLTFPSAYEKWEAKRAFNILGNIQPLLEISAIVQELYQARLPYSTKGEWQNYATNNGVILSKNLLDVKMEQLIGLIENIAYNYNAEIKITDLTTF